jgi:hypothetical protein
MARMILRAIDKLCNDRSWDCTAIVDALRIFEERESEETIGIKKLADELVFSPWQSV